MLKKCTGGLFMALLIFAVATPATTQDVAPQENVVRVAIDTYFDLASLQNFDAPNGSNILMRKTDGKVVELVDDHLLRGVGAGLASVFQLQGDQVVLLCRIEVFVPEMLDANVDLNRTRFQVDDKYSFVFSPVPRSSSVADYQWRSSNPKVMTITPSGNAVAISAGECEISVLVNGSVTKAIAVRVEPVVAARVYVDKPRMLLAVGDRYNLSATVEPANSFNKSVTWESSNSEVVSVDSLGRISCLKLGTASIVGRTTNGLSATCTVVVSNLVRIRILDNNGMPVVPSQIFAFDSKEKTTSTPTELSDDEVVFAFNVAKTVHVLIADPRFAGKVLRDIKTGSNLTCTIAFSSTGSVIAPDGSCNIPNFGGRLNPIKDSQGRLYLYASNVSISGGQQQPVYFSPGFPLTLIDNEDRKISLVFRFIDGNTSLMDYSR